MKLHLTRDEFLALWRIHRGYSPLRTDTSVQRSDGMDLDTILLAEMDDWYLRLLLEADAAMLAPRGYGGIGRYACPGRRGGNIGSAS